MLSYRAAFTATGNQLVWFDRAGTRIKPVGEPGPYGSFSLSPDEKSVVVDRNDPQTGTSDIWRLDLSRGVASRLTFDPAQDQGPLSSPDGSRLVFFSARSRSGSLYQKSFAGNDDEELLVKSPLRDFPEDWSPDGRYIVYQAFDPDTNTDLYLLSTFGERKSTVLLRTPFDERDARFSPDGRWIAYASNETGSYEVYVQKFPLSGAKWRISIHGGAEPAWSPNGRELFYIVEGKFMAVDLKTGSSGLEAGQPTAILGTVSLNPNVGTGGAFGSASHRYAVGADGQRFLVNVPVGTTTSTPITVVLTWTAGLGK